MKIIDYSMIPEHCRDGLKHYIEFGIPPGDFLYAVLTNNLVEAAFRADTINIHHLHRYAKWLYWEVPSACWGTPAKVTTWIEHRGLNGWDNKYLNEERKQNAEDGSNSNQSVERTPDADHPM